MTQIDIIKRNIDRLETALAPLDAFLGETVKRDHPLHLTRIENEVIKGRARVLKGLEYLRLRAGV
jgi:hypothetical protein